MGSLVLLSHVLRYLNNAAPPACWSWLQCCFNLNLASVKLLQCQRCVALSLAFTSHHCHPSGDPSCWPPQHSMFPVWHSVAWRLRHYGALGFHSFSFTPLLAAPTAAFPSSPHWEGSRCWQLREYSWQGVDRGPGCC